MLATAVVTLKLSPSAFALAKSALLFRQETLKQILSANAYANSRDRKNLREELAEVMDLLNNLK